MTWQPIETAPELENVLVCQHGWANSAQVMYRGDGSPKHPATWIEAHERRPVSEFEMPDYWMPIEKVPTHDREQP